MHAPPPNGARGKICAAESCSVVQREGHTEDNIDFCRRLPHIILPWGPELHLKLQNPARARTTISWKALLQASRCVVIDKDARHELRLCQPWSALEALQMGTPWKRTISSSQSLHDLLPSLPCRPGSYFWQNKAQLQWTQAGSSQMCGTDGSSSYSC